MNVQIPEPIHRKIAALALRFGKIETACPFHAVLENRDLLLSRIRRTAH
ncbi:MAG: hypothetical protein GXP50_11850 [Deltaproteobacteria bacterium]|nr:hypothetical protein [Deltaproteobacteria bacterium]